MILTVLALDPGGTTGWAYFRAETLYNPEQERREYINSKWLVGQLESPEHHDELNNFLGQCHTTDYRIICERFEYRNQSRAGLDLSSREYIGVTKRFCQARQVPLMMQTAAQAKGFVKDAHIKKLGLWSPGKKHAMDALRHLLFYLTNSYEDRDFRLSLLEKGWK
jgi:hypothetical protein